LKSVTASTDDPAGNSASHDRHHVGTRSTPDRDAAFPAQIHPLTTSQFSAQHGSHQIK